MCLTCAFDLFFENELSNCLLPLLLAVYLFFVSFWGCLWVAVLSPSLDFMCYGGMQYFCFGDGCLF